MNARPAADEPAHDGLLARAARLLATDSPLGGLSEADALRVMDYMVPSRLPEGTVLLRQGEAVDNDFLLLVVEGEATVELEVGMKAEHDLVLTVIGPGGIVGAMGALDGDPRSASAVASTEMVVALMSRASLLHMIQTDPALAARFLLAVTSRLFDRFRQTTKQIRTYMRVNRSLMEQLHHALPDSERQPTLAIRAEDAGRPPPP